MSDARPVMPRWLSLYTLPLAAFAALSYATEDQALILILNIVLAAFATTIVVSFSGEQVRIAFDRGPMSRGAWFAFGIWWSWGAVDFRIGESLVWRYLNEPAWLINSDITSFGLFASCVGAIGHIVRPGDLAERLPRREVVKVALIAGAAVALGLAYLLWPDIRAAWVHQAAVWFRTPGIESAVAGPPPTTFSRAEDVPDDIVRALARRAPVEPAPAPPTRSATVPLDDILRDDDAAGGQVRMDTTLSPADAARVEQSRVDHGDRSRRATLRRLIPRALDDEDRDAFGGYDAGRR